MDNPQRFVGRRNGGPEFWGEVQPPASLKRLDIPSRRAVFVAGNRAEGRRSEWETRLFVEEPMLSTGLHFASESTKAGVSSLMTGLNIADGNNQKTRTKQSPNRCGTRLIKPWLRAARCRTQRLISPIHRPRLLRAMLRNRWTRQKASPRKRKSGLSARSLNKRELAPTTSTT